MRLVLTVVLVGSLTGVQAGSTELRFSSVTAGDEFTCAHTRQGEPWCWGANQYGQLGSGVVHAKCKGVMFVVRGACSLKPVRVAGGLRFRVIDAGSYHACGLIDSGRAYCWGRNALGELGRQSVSRQCVAGRFVEPCTYIPVPVETELRFSAISAANSFTCALTIEGIPYCWGLNSDGVYGAGNVTNVDHRVTRISAPTRFVELSSSGSQTCARSAEGQVFCWGEGLSAQATSLELPGKAVGVSRGWGHTCALLSTGDAYCWGENSSGEIGVGPVDSIHEVEAPTHVARELRFRSLVAGFSGTCGITAQQELFCWGSQSALGSHAKDKCFHIDAFSGCTWTPARAPFVSVSSVTLGFLHACAVTEAGVAYCWGHNYAGELGRGNRRGSETPVPIDALGHD